MFLSIICLPILIIFHVVIPIGSRDEQQTAAPKLLRKIIGGADCATEQYPFMVSIRSTTQMKHFCGGSLIKPDFVLTAAHCIIVHNPNYYTAVVGTSESNRRGVQRRSVRTIIIHKKFNSDNLRNDIAVMELKYGFDMNSKLVGLIELPPSLGMKNVKDNCEEATVIGWGHRESWNPKTSNLTYEFKPVLQCVSIPLMTHQECVSLRGKPLFDNVICAYSPGGSKDACQGDSGGPLFCGNIQYGIVSSGYGCGLPNSPGYYSRVDHHLDLIEAVISRKDYSRCGMSLPASDRNKAINVFNCTSLMMILISLLLNEFI